MPYHCAHHKRVGASTGSVLAGRISKQFRADIRQDRFVLVVETLK